MYHILLYSKSSDRGNQRNCGNIKGTQAIMDKAEEQRRSRPVLNDKNIFTGKIF